MPSNLRNLGLDVLDVVNLRSMFGTHGPAEGSIVEPLSVLAELQRQGLVRHIGLSNVTPMQVALAWLLRRAPNILLIPGTSSVAHMQENLAAAECTLPVDAARELDSVTHIGAI